MRKTALLLASLALIGFTVFAFRDPVAFRRSFVMQLQMEEREPQIFFGTDLAEPQALAFLRNLGVAQKAADNFFGSRRAHPIVAYADHKELKDRLAVGNPYASSYFHFSDILIVIAPRGNHPDVMAHAYAHAEVKQRLGEEVFAQLPAWFDEGLCTLLDQRKFLSDATLDAQEAEGIEIPSFATMEQADWFLGPEGESHLVFAKREVRRWYRLVGQQGVLQLFERVAAGEDFLSVYHELELR